MKLSDKAAEQEILAEMIDEAVRSCGAFTSRELAERLIERGVTIKGKSKRSFPMFGAKRRRENKRK